MKSESHLESYKEHREVIFEWALKVKGLKNSQRIVGTHASRAAIDLLCACLLKKGVIDVGTQINHRWFKSSKVMEKLPEFDNKESIIPLMIKLELLCEDLTYGAPKPEENVNEAVVLLNNIEAELKYGEE